MQTTTPMPGSAVQTRSRKPHASGPSMPRSTTSAFRRIATSSSTRGTEPSTRYCQPWLSSRFVSTRTKPLSTSTIASRDRTSSVSRARHPRVIVGRTVGAACAFTGCSQAGYRQITAFAALAKGLAAWRPQQWRRSWPATSSSGLTEFLAHVDGQPDRADDEGALAARRTRAAGGPGGLARGALRRRLAAALPALRALGRRATSAKLRQKLEEAAPHWRYIHTHFGFGYRFDAQPLAIALLSLFTPPGAMAAEHRGSEVPPRNRRHGSGAPRPGPFCFLGVVLGGGALAGALHQLVMHGPLAAGAAASKSRPRSAPTRTCRRRSTDRACPTSSPAQLRVLDRARAARRGCRGCAASGRPSPCSQCASSPRSEAVDARVLQEAADDRDDADVLADPGDARAQAADRRAR